MRPQPQYREGPRTAVLGPFDAASGRVRGIAVIVAVGSVAALFWAAGEEGVPGVAIDFRIKLDKTAPVVTGGAPARGADVNGWYNHAVPIAFSGSDQTSGIAA